MHAVGQVVNFFVGVILLRQRVSGRGKFQKKTPSAQDPMRNFIVDTLLVLNSDKSEDTADRSAKL